MDEGAIRANVFLGQVKALERARPMCPDHRDKFADVQCIACHFEKLTALAEGTPDPRSMVADARQALGLFNGAMPKSYADVWTETLEAMRSLKAQLTATGLERDKWNHEADQWAYRYNERKRDLADAREAVREAAEYVRHAHNPGHRDHNSTFCVVCLWLALPSVQQAVSKEGNP